MEFIYLPLVSYRGGKHVPERSGLNQFNANGRPRNIYEVYIPVPQKIHNNFPNFFPLGNYFNLYLPNGRQILASLCQENLKAIMSNPNSDLGEWLLRDVLNKELGEIVREDDLISSRVDSVIVYKINNSNYVIAIAPWGSYDQLRERMI